MPLGRKHLRRSRDAPTGGIGRMQRTTSNLGFNWIRSQLLDDPAPLWFQWISYIFFVVCALKLLIDKHLLSFDALRGLQNIDL
jgi:hypothetical protein